jgi:hypothetical protein
MCATRINLLMPLRKDLMAGPEQANTVRRDVYPDAAWAAVKLAIRQTVARAGGVDAVATQCRVAHKARVSEWQNLQSDDFPNLWQVGQLEGLAGVDWITQAMAALHDADLVKRGRAEGEGAVLIRLASAAKEGGEAVAATANLAALPACRKAAANAIKEHHEAIRAHKELIAALEGLIGEAA